MRSSASTIGIVGALFVAMGLALASGELQITRKSQPVQIQTVRPEANCSDTIVLTLIGSLRQQPSDWDSNNFRLEKGDSGIAVWVANEEYGLTIGETSVSPNSGYDVPGPECEVLLYSEIQKWQRQKLMQRLR